RKLEARQPAGRDEDLAEAAAALLLFLERVPELRLGNETALDEDLADRPLAGRNRCRVCVAAPLVGDGHEIAILGVLLALLEAASPLAPAPLLGEAAGQVEPLHAELVDEDLTQPIARLTLPFEGDLELLLGDEALLDEHQADQTGGDSRLIHGRSIGNPS